MQVLSISSYEDRAHPRKGQVICWAKRLSIHASSIWDRCFYLSVWSFDCSLICAGADILVQVLKADAARYNKAILFYVICDVDLGCTRSMQLPNLCQQNQILRLNFSFFLICIVT
jgi:hypothetical protein